MALSSYDYRKLLIAAKEAPDGNWYAPDPERPGKYLQLKYAAGDSVKSDAGDESQRDFEKRWGVAPEEPVKGAIKAPAADTDEAFEKRWSVGASTPPETPAASVNNPTGAANAFTGGFARGIPILGSAIDAGAHRAAAGIRSLAYGTPYADELKAVSDYAVATAKEHPKTEFAGNVAGAVTALAPAAVAAPTLMGLTGSLGQRALMGGTSGAAINAADAAVRSGGDPLSTGVGALTGSTFGAAAPAVGQGVGALVNRVIKPSIDPVTNYLATRAAELGIPIRPPQTSTRPFINKLDQMVGQLPGSTTPRLHAEQQSAITRAVSRTFGEDADKITPEVMRAAKKRLGGEFEDVTQNMSLSADKRLADKLTEVAANTRFMSQDQARIVGEHLNDITERFGGSDLAGKAYHSLVKRGSALDRATKGSDRDVAKAAQDIRAALDDAATRQNPPELSQRLTEARRQYRNMKTIQPLVTKGEPGEISPLLLNQRVNAAFPDRAFSGAGELGDIADIGQKFMRQPRDSGTPIGNVIMNLLTHHGALVGAGVLGGGGAGASYLAGENPLKGLGLGLGGLAGTAVSARAISALLNNPTVLRSIVERAPYLAPATSNALRLTVRPSDAALTQ